MNLTIRNHEMNHEGHWNVSSGNVQSFTSDNGITYPLSRMHPDQVKMAQEIADVLHATTGKFHAEWIVIEHTVEGFVDYSDAFGWTIDEVTIDGQDPSEWGDVWYEAATEVLTDRFEQLTC
jgi:hypothetical protein